MAENLSNLAKHINLGDSEMSKPQSINSKKSTPKHSRIKSLKLKTKIYLIAGREKQTIGEI